MKFIWTNRIIFILSIIGLIISGYLFYTYVFDTPMVCVNTGCEVVRDSPYAYFLGIPLPLYGGLMYLGIFILSFTSTIFRKKFAMNALKMIFGLALVGVVISTYLTYLELFVIKAVCTWCAASAVAIFLVLVVSSYGLWAISHET